MSPELPVLSILRRSWPEYASVGTTHRVQVGKVTFGGGKPVIIAGPCAVESYEQTLRIARAVRDAGGTLLRGGAYKPRTSPHSFQGLGREGLEILAAAREETGLGIVTEVLDPRLVEEVAGYADMLQIGSRSAQNFPLLREVGQQPRPVLLKRGWSSTLEEWLCAAEYVAVGGNRNIVLCERGIRASCHWEYARNVLDLNVIEPARRATPLPVIVDPSHATGTWSLVASMSRAALAAGAHGLLIEATADGIDRARLRCDGAQGIPPEILREIVGFAAANPVPAIQDAAPAPVG
ncbi:MAG: 3-deoxy-7-phosphoheptulonate synthase [Acidobacteriota bacterium]|jgi:3-deoxy-7-phosphoheptulonate synthase